MRANGWTPEDIAQLCALRGQRQPWLAIAQVLHRTPSACQVKYHELRQRQDTKALAAQRQRREQDYQFEHLLAQGARIVDIAKALNISFDAAQSRRRRYLHRRRTA